jgi:hypothetical protein
MGAVAPGGQRTAGDDPGLGAGDPDPLDHPGALGVHRAGGVGGAGEQLGHHAQHRAEAAGQHRGGQQQPVGVGGDRQLPAVGLQQLGDLQLVVPGGAQQQGAGEHARPGRVDGGLPGRGGGEGHPQSQLDQRHAGPRDDDQPQPVGQRGLVHLGDRGGARLAQRRDQGQVQDGRTHRD